jgi:thymidylate synthase
MGALTKLAITADNVHSFLKMDGDPFPTHRLNLWMGQRSADHVIGVPFNIASYALLAHMLAAQANMVPGEFLWVGGDVHLYSNLQGAAEVQLTREPRPFPKVLLKKVSTIFDYTLDDIELVDYKPMPAIKTEIAV